MLDPLTSLSVASSVIRIVDFSRKLVSETQEVYHSASGATRDNVTSREITQDINLLYQDLRSKNEDFQISGPHDIALRKLVDSCTGEAQALMKILEDLKVPPDAKQWKIFKTPSKVHRKEEMLMRLRHDCSRYKGRSTID